MLDHGCTASTPTLTATPAETATPGGALLAAKHTARPPAGLPIFGIAGFFLLAGIGLTGYALALRRSG